MRYHSQTFLRINFYLDDSNPFDIMQNQLFVSVSFHSWIKCPYVIILWHTWVIHLLARPKDILQYTEATLSAGVLLQLKQILLKVDHSSKSTFRNITIASSCDRLSFFSPTAKNCKSKAECDKQGTCVCLWICGLVCVWECVKQACCFPWFQVLILKYPACIQHNQHICMKVVSILLF